MRYRIMTLFLALCLLCGVALAGFGGSQEDVPDEISEEEELPTVGGWSEEESYEVDSSVFVSEMAIGPGSEAPGTAPAALEGTAGTPVAGETFAMYPWAPSEGAFTPEPSQSPIGVYETSYDSTVGAYYTTVAPPVAEQKALITYNTVAAPPTAVYYQGAYVPWTTFTVTFPRTSPAFWVSTFSGWSWYAVCPFHGWVRELMYVPKTGTLKVYEIYPSGQTRFYNYGWASPGYKYIWFYGDSPGRHIAIFTVSDTPSNAVTVDVV